ncbi:MAG: UDP-N-acetylmuramate dehydrogenase [Gammaproteobacteria bacterium]
MTMTPTWRGVLRENEPLARHNSWHVGGKARRCYLPADISDLQIFLQNQPKDEEFIWLGLGSNVLIRDGGVAGTVIITQNRLKQLQRLTPHRIRAEAGIPCAKLAKYCANLGLAEAAFFAGIPGTVGGALAMNAGAFGGETWRYVEAVETIDRNGKINVRYPHEFQVDYRHVLRPNGEWFVAGHFQFPLGDVEQVQRAIRELLRQRNTTQPIGEFNCGSVFRNPPGNHAARLIESCGLKGWRVGGAWVSEKHANFIINGGEATAANIENLIYFVQQKVKEQHGIELKPEVHILGENEISNDEVRK